MAVETETLEQAAARVVRQGVLLNVTQCVLTVAGTWGHDHINEDLDALHDQAQELASPVPDYESAAREAGWTKTPEGWWWREPTQEEIEEGVADFYFLGSGPYVQTPDATKLDDIEPHEHEVYEFWAVDSWLADKLEAEGEKIDRDFCGWNVWARTTTGQLIQADYVIEKIAKAVRA